MSRRSPCDRSSSPNPPFSRSDQSPAASPSPIPYAEQFPGARPTASLRARTCPFPAQSNIPPPPARPLLSPTQHSLPALALRQLLEPELPIVPLRTISCHSPCSPPPCRIVSRHSPCGNSSSLNSPALPLRTISWRLTPFRTVSRRSPCGISSSPKSPCPRPEQYNAAPFARRTVSRCSPCGCSSGRNSPYALA